MNTKTKIAAIIAILLIVLGILLVGIGYNIIGNDLTQLYTEIQSQSAYIIWDSFEDIRVHTNADVSILPSSDGGCAVICEDSKNRYHTVKVENGTLVVEQTTVEHIFQFNIMIQQEPTVTIYLPESQYANLSVEGSSGDIQDVDPSFTFQNVQLNTSSGSIRFRASLTQDLSVATSSGDIQLSSCHVGGDAQVNSTSGKIHLSDVKTGALTLGSSSGDIILESVHAQAIRSSATSGSITLSGCEAQQDISAQTSSGDIRLTNTKAAASLHTAATSGQVELTEVTAPNMTGSSSSGDLRLYNVLVGGQLNLETTSGSISLDSSDAQSLVIHTSSGDVSGTLLSPKFFITHTSSGSVETSDPDPAGGRCEITTSSGNIKMTAE